MPLIEMAHIAKFHGGRPVLTNVSVMGRSGEFHLIMGCNGAGKTTLLRIMAGLSRPASGQIKTRARTAYLGHQTWLYPTLTALENLAFQAKINGIHTTRPTLMALLERAGLKYYAQEQTRIFSRGMAQRLNFCRILLLDPRIFLLDEPFTGMDQASRALMADEIASRQANGACIFMVSHNPEADGLNATHTHTLHKGVLS